MIEREKEKVISHLRIIRTWNKVDKDYAHDDVDKKEKAKTVEWIDDALELLKEQEAEKKCCRDCEYYGACHDE